MNRSGPISIAFTGRIVVVLSLVALSSVSLAHSEGRVWLAAEPTPGMPTCEEFYEKWEAPGAPAGMLAMMGYAREIMAAKDCLKQNNIPMACEHWSKLLAVVDKLGPPLDERRGDVEEMMHQQKCAAPASEPTSPSKAAPTSPE